MKEMIRRIRDEISGEQIFSDVKEIATFHRIQSSTGFRAAAEHIAQKLQSDGIDCRIKAYPFDEKTWYLSSRSFLEWDCKEAWCELVTPERRRIADYRANKIAVIQRSYACDHQDQPLEIVMLDKGPAEEAYEGLDLEGKLIFVRDAFNPYMDWAFSKRGAVGLITDFMRAVPGVRVREDLYDVRNYTSFWWKDTSIEPKIFGFVLTPRQGDELADLCRKMQEEHDKDPSKAPYPQARCKVDASLYPGSAEVVEARLAGQTDEEILVIAHLCHPQASANDNASGVASAMELFRVIKRLVDQGEVPPLKRGLRMIFVPEFSGTYAWLAEEIDRHRFVAGINLDMVGGRQTHGYGPLTITAQPHAAPSIVTDVAALCLDEVKKNVVSHNPDNYVAMFNHHVGEFTAGSDHYILSDPTVGIPTPMLGQWPDIHYHTAADTVECIDPFILHKSASIAGAYVYWLSNLSVDQVYPVLCKTLERAAADLASIPARALEEGKTIPETEARMAHYLGYYEGVCGDLARFFEPEVYREQVAGLADEFLTAIEAQAEHLMAAYLVQSGGKPVPEEEEVPFELYSYVPVRRFRSPILHLDDYAIGDPSLMEAHKAYTEAHYKKVLSPHAFEAFVQYYMDGKRTLAQIAREVLIEARGGDIEFVHDFVQLLVAYGIVEVA